MKRPCDSVHLKIDCLLSSLFRLTSTKTSKHRITGPLWENHRWLMDSHHKGPVMWKMYSWHYAIMIKNTLWKTWNEISLSSPEFASDMRNLSQTSSSWYLVTNFTSVRNIYFKIYCQHIHCTFRYLRNVWFVGFRYWPNLLTCLVLVNCQRIMPRGYYVR